MKLNFSKSSELSGRMNGVVLVVRVLVFVVPAAITAGLIYWYVSAHRMPPPQDIKTRTAVIEKAESQKYGGSKSDAEATLKAAIAENKNVKDQAYYHLQLGSLYESQKDYQAAMEQYKLTENLKVDNISTIAIPGVARCAEAMGDKATAITYYRMAYKTVNKSILGYEGTMKTYEAKIIALGGTL